MLSRLTRALVSVPAIYDLVQNAAGQAKVAARFRQTISMLDHGRIVDVGSAGGRMADRLGVEPVYVDIDVRPLFARRRRTAAARLVGADAARLPFLDGAFDVALCLLMSHHLSHGDLARVIAELARVTAGVLFFADIVRNDARWVSRLLWRYDRGRHPRTKEEILAALGIEFDLIEVSDFAVYHQYVLCVARPRGLRDRRVESEPGPSGFRDEGFSGCIASPGSSRAPRRNFISEVKSSGPGKVQLSIFEYTRRR